MREHKETESKSAGGAGDEMGASQEDGVSQGAEKARPGLPGTLKHLIANPLRLATVLGLFFLVVPGSLAGLSLLLLHAGLIGSGLRISPPAHGAAQLVGFFLVFIWGFLVHGFPGILGARRETTRPIAPRMVIASSGLILLLLGDMLGVRWFIAGGVLIAAGASAAITAAFGRTFLQAGRKRTRTPLPFLFFGILCAPIYWFFLGLQLTGRGSLPAADFLLLGAVIPIVLSMGYRMLPSLGGFRIPHGLIFVLGAWVWALGVVLWSAAFFIPPSVLGGLELIARAGFAAASVLFYFSMRMGEPLRQGRKRSGDATDGPLRAYVRAGYAWLLVGAAVWLLNSFPVGGKLLPGNAWYWDDVGRHAFGLGFAFFVVAGITQRIFPTFLRGKPVVKASAWLVWWLLSAGLALRFVFEPFLPYGAVLVGLSGFLLYTGILLYGFNLARGLRPA